MNLREKFMNNEAKQNRTIDDLKKRLSEIKAELEAAIESHKEALDSKQFIASIVTPLCLFGALAFIALAFVAYSCAKGSRELERDRTPFMCDVSSRPPPPPPTPPPPSSIRIRRYLYI